MPVQVKTQTLEIRGHDGTRIRCFQDWQRHALPPMRRGRHWKAGRSECELAREWTCDGEPRVPARLSQLLDSHKGTVGISFTEGDTQLETTLPFSQKGRRCHDLALLGEQHDRLVTLCIEAKADESFGGAVKDLLDNRRRQSPKTRFPYRLDWLTRSLLNTPAFKDDAKLKLTDQIAGLQYQLLAAVAGTLLEAKKNEAGKAILLVHEFRTSSTLDENLKSNANDLKVFLRLLSAANMGLGVCSRVKQNFLIGPVSIIDRSFGDDPKLPYHIPLFIGKIRTDRLANRRTMTILSQ